MATGSGIIRKISGKVGDLVYFVRGGQQIIRGVSTSSKNSRTSAQMMQRMKWPNIVAVYKTLSPYLKDCFENKPAGQTDYNRFMSINLNTEPVYLEKGEVRLGAAIVAPYVISQGSLPSIQVSGATPATDIALGALEIGDDTTVGELAQAVVQNNSGYRYGDQLSFFRLVQEEDSQDGHPYVTVSATRVNLDPADTSVLRDVRRRDAGSGRGTGGGRRGLGAQPDGERQDARQLATPRRGQRTAGRARHHADVVHSHQLLRRHHRNLHPARRHLRQHDRGRGHRKRHRRRHRRRRRQRGQLRLRNRRVATSTMKDG